ncbi:Uncharacterized conserved protein, DUF885 familyt [Nakamurella panacisegetis]|uniref:Uncharacterized conserved protein, DUF885 familyt n=1 Tax=Nakamurella panacisegetis TaxID=1090615 RepID=A0A1H0Q6A0_9ACTN|nr:DUF885 domain-containing protein [Nakamurella panacisegetis]SDP12947.1 Uncharacterized conserved protein, DUF885 familyt [Nakamurella panacisegetis]
MTDNTAEATDPADSTQIDQISDQFVRDLVAISPMTATQLGVSDFDDQLDDFSPAGLARVQELVVRTLAALADTESTGPSDDVARSVIVERLEVERDRYESGWGHAALNVIASPVQHTRMIFDMTPSETPEQLAVFARRMRAVPAALDGYRESLRLGASRGQVAAVRQVRKCAGQCDAFSSFFGSTVSRFVADGPLRDELAEAAAIADRAYADLATFLRDELAAAAPVEDAVGRERYVLASREFLGATVDLEQTYAWGWAEIAAIEAEMKTLAERIAPGEGVKGAAARLDADPSYTVHGQDKLKAWMQALSDRAVDELGRTHFDIPEPLRSLECLIAPPGSGVGAYYTPPSDDFSRPGRMWWSVEADRIDFSTWRETTVVYHEGVPGHHLQIGTSVYRSDRLNDFQRVLAGTSGHAEGWALYAERLVREVGYLRNDGDLLGMLDSQMFRAARVVLDIGMHLQLPIPEGAGFHDGATWTPELGLEFLLSHTLMDATQCRDEIDRYLGWPGQAPAYKVGERVWIAGRDAARARHGKSFDEKAFHTSALNLGGMGLEPLEAELAKL